MHGGEEMSDDKIEIFFTFDPIPDAILDRKDLSKPIIKILPSQTCKTKGNELFVKPREKIRRKYNEHRKQNDR